MWIFGSKGFLSLVADRNNPGQILVRSRFADDIHKAFPKAKVTETPNADYRFRASVKRSVVARVIANSITDINYDNYKASIKDHASLAHVAHQCWSVLRDEQQFLYAPKTKKNLPKCPACKRWDLFEKELADGICGPCKNAGVKVPDKPLVLAPSKGKSHKVGGGQRARLYNEQAWPDDDGGQIDYLGEDSIAEFTDDADIPPHGYVDTPMHVEGAEVAHTHAAPENVVID